MALFESRSARLGKILIIPQDYGRVGNAAAGRGGTGQMPNSRLRGNANGRDNVLRSRAARLLSTTVLVTAFASYGRIAYAACAPVGGSAYQCSGEETTSQAVNANNAAVSTLADFSVD